MDLNRLYFEQQLALMRASRTEDMPARARHHARAENFLRHIAQLRQDGAHETGMLACQG